MLAIRDLHVYYGGIHALNGISLDVPDGQIVSLIGANGAGKNTTLKAIMGLVNKAEGNVYWDSTDITVMKIKPFPTAAGKNLAAGSDALRR